jgi:hypothetical protein
MNENDTDAQHQWRDEGIDKVRLWFGLPDRPRTDSLQPRMPEQPKESFNLRPGDRIVAAFVLDLRGSSVFVPRLTPLWLPRRQLLTMAFRSAGVVQLRTRQRSYDVEDDKLLTDRYWEGQPPDGSDGWDDARWAKELRETARFFVRFALGGRRLLWVEGCTARELQAALAKAKDVDPAFRNL